MLLPFPHPLRLQSQIDRQQAYRILAYIFSAIVIIVFAIVVALRRSISTGERAAATTTTSHEAVASTVRPWPPLLTGSRAPVLLPRHHPLTAQP